MKVLTQLGVAVLLIAIAVRVFRRVRQEYEAHGRLGPFATFLQVLIFFLHGCASYAFVDSRTARIDMGSAAFPAAVAFLSLGLLLVLATMSRLGWAVSMGRDVCGLRRTGFYRYTRNPQIVAYLVAVAGYALLWPSWSGGIWVLLCMAIAHMMVRTEEEHLRRAYGPEYEEYCRRTPRYLGLPKS